MQILTNIDEEDYYNLIEQAKKYPPDMFTKIQNNIINGTPLNDVLDKIRADVINIADGRQSMPVRSIIKIIDKYKTENEG